MSRRAWSWILLVFAATGALYILSLGRTPLLVHSEIRCWRIAQGMLDTGDYLVPRLGDELRTQKPPLYYWMTCAAAKLRGDQTLFTHRFPSVLAAFGVLLIVLQWCREVGFTLAQALFSLFSLGTTYLFIVHARRGSFEMSLTLFCSVTLYALYRLREGFRWSYGSLAAICFGLGFLTKATPVFVFVALPFAAWLVLQKRLVKVLRDWRFYALFLLAMVIGLSWYAVVMQRVPEARRIIVGEALLPLGVEDEEVKTATHYAPPWFFILGIWRTAFPISLLLPVVVAEGWRRRGFEPGSAWRLMILAVLLPFLVFSVIPQKQDHYLLPIFPLLALLGTHSATVGLQRATGFSPKWVWFAGWVVVPLLVIAASLATFGLHVVADTALVVAALAGVAILASAGVAVVALKRGSLSQASSALLAGVFLSMICYFALLRPIEDGFHSGRIFLSKKYNEQAWEDKFRRYPWLRTALKAEKGESKVDRERRREQKLLDPNRPKKKKDSGRTN
jgi:4-amino-4-deoxy-L-arabinose transferase-like glycosyltransferase